MRGRPVRPRAQVQEQRQAQVARGRDPRAVAAQVDGDHDTGVEPCGVGQCLGEAGGERGMAAGQGAAQPQRPERAAVAAARAERGAAGRTRRGPRPGAAEPAQQPGVGVRVERGPGGLAAQGPEDLPYPGQGAVTVHQGVRGAEHDGGGRLPLHAGHDQHLAARRFRSPRRPGGQLDRPGRRVGVRTGARYVVPHLRQGPLGAPHRPGAHEPRPRAGRGGPDQGCLDVLGVGYAVALDDDAQGHGPAGVTGGEVEAFGGRYLTPVAGVGTRPGVGTDVGTGTGVGTDVGTGLIGCHDCVLPCSVWSGAGPADAVVPVQAAGPAVQAPTPPTVVTHSCSPRSPSARVRGAA